MSKYIRVSKGFNKQTMIKAEDDLFARINDQDDFYNSLYYYDQEHYDKFLLTKSAAGITGLKTNKIIYDFDSKSDIELARKDAVELSDRLVTSGLNESDFRIYFSGFKGFHIDVRTNQEFTRSEYESILNNTAGDLNTLDKKVTDEQRLFRTPLTKHKNSGLYKIPLSLNALKTMTIDDIKEQARFVDLTQQNNVKTQPAVNLPESILKFKTMSPVAQQKTEVVATGLTYESIDFSKMPKYMKPERWALAQGFFEAGERNDALHVLGASYRALGFDETDTFHLLKSAAEKQSKRTGQPVFQDNEIRNNIIKHIYSPNYKGGVYTVENSDILKKTVERCKIDLVKNESVNRITDVSDRFIKYAKNIRNNTLKTGIAELDENIMITTGMMIGLLGAPGCHAKGTKVVMFDGTFKNVEDVVLGDLLMGPDSKPRKVLDTIVGNERMVKIKPIRNEPFVVNENHILHLQYPQGMGSKKRFNTNIKVKDYIENTTGDFKRRYKLKTQGVEYSNNLPLEIPPYILGSWLGDGHSSGSSITTMDIELVESWSQYASEIGMKFRTSPSKSSGKAKTYSISSGKHVGFERNVMLTKLQKLNLIDNKHIPDHYLRASRKDRLELLAGLIDTDGSRGSNKINFMISQKNENIINQIQILARSLGFHCTKRKIKGVCSYKGVRKVGIYYSLYIAGDCFEIPVRLTRKKVTKAKRNTNPEYQGFTFEYLPNDNYYGFTLSGDHLYLTSDFVIHHNSSKTTWANTIVENMSREGDHVIYFSLDMPDHLLYARYIQKYTGYDIKTLFYKIESGEQDPKLQEAIIKVNEDLKNVHLDFRSGLRLEDMDLTIQSYKDTTGHNPRLIVVDYLEKVHGPFQDPTANSGFIAARLADMAKKHDVCLLLLLQPQKAAGDASEPLLSMRKVKGASVIEQDCRVILTIWRPGFYPKDQENDKYVSLAVVKNNMGPTAQFDFHWDGLTGKIGSMNELDRDRFNETLGKIKMMKSNDAAENESPWSK